MNSFSALIKREFWEHKGSILYTPAIMAAVFAVLMLVGGLTGDSLVVEDGHRIDFTAHIPDAVEKFEKMPDDVRDKAVQMMISAPVLLFGMVMLFISLFYALGSLYDERKDRSILFWKSLPVSDTATVASKIVAICLLVPLLYFIVVGLFQLYFLLYMTVGAWFNGSSGLFLWSSSNLFGILFNTLLSLVVASFWLAPLWGWMMLASSFAKKVAFLWGSLPILMIAVAERWFFHTTNFISMVGERIAQGFAIQNSNMHFLSGADMFDEINVLRWNEALVTGEFWLGILVAAIFLGAAIYVRRYRDES